MYSTIAVIVVFGVLVGLFLHRKQSQDLAVCLHRLERDRGGRFEAGGLLSLPKLFLEIEQASVEVSAFAGTKHTPAQTYGQAYLASPPAHRFRVSNGHQSTWIDGSVHTTRGPKLEPLQVDQSEITGYTFFTSDEAFLRPILNECLLDRLAVAPQGKQVRVTLDDVHRFDGRAFRDDVRLWVSLSPPTLRDDEFAWILDTATALLRQFGSSA